MSQLLLSNLGAVCPACDELNPPSTAKCVGCGADVFGPLPAAKALPKIPGPVKSTNPQLPSIQAPPVLSAVPPPAAAPPAATATPAPGMSPKASAPPGLKPSGRSGPTLTVPEPQPIPASELIKKPSAPQAAPAAAPSRFSLSVIGGPLRGQKFKLPPTCQVGRTQGAVLLGEDQYVSALHATFSVKNNQLYVKDEGTASGTFLAIPGQAQIQQNVHFAAGGRLFRFMGLLTATAPKPNSAAMIYGAPMPPGHVVYGVEEIMIGNRGGRAVVTGGALLTIGTSKCDLSFPSEEGMAARHCELSPTPQGALLRDLSGGLGTFVRLGTAERPLNPGDKLKLGATVVQVEG